jgi:hypothetical protein
VQKVYFIAVNASLRGLNNVSWLILAFPLIKETWTKYTPITLLSYLNKPQEIHFLHYKIIGANKKFKN